MSLQIYQAPVPSDYMKLGSCTSQGLNFLCQAFCRWTSRHGNSKLLLTFFSTPPRPEPELSISVSLPAACRITIPPLQLALTVAKFVCSHEPPRGRPEPVFPTARVGMLHLKVQATGRGGFQVCLRYTLAPVAYCCNCKGREFEICPTLRAEVLGN